MPVTRSPSEVTTSPAARPFQALPWSKMWPSPSHWVEHCSGMAITSSAPPKPCGKPWLPRSASDAGVGHGVDRVGASPPALLRAVGVERLGQREGLARLYQGCCFNALVRVDEVQGPKDVVLAPAAPVVVGFGHGADAAERIVTPDDRGIGG